MGNVTQRRASAALMGAALVISMAGCAVPSVGSPDPESSPGTLLFTVRRGHGSVVYTADPDGSGLHEIETGDVAASGPVWAPDASRIAFAGCVVGKCDSTRIYVMSADGTALRRLTDGPSDWDPAWSPDGSRIVFSRLLDDGHSRLFVVDVESGAVTQLTDDATYQDHDADWSPDGTQIAFMRNADTFPSIYVVDADGTNLRRLVQMRPAADTAPAWSPDGKQIAFVRDEDQGSTYNLYVMDADGTDVHQVAEGAGAFRPPEPVWSPDGDSIAFFRDATLYALHVATSRETQIIELQKPLGAVDWSS